jgi:ion channel
MENPLAKRSPWKYLGVLACQIYLFVVAPFLQLAHARFVFALLILTSIGALPRATWRFRIAMLLGLPAMALNHVENPPWSDTGNMLSIAFLIFVTWAIQLDLTKRRSVDENTLIGAVVGYLMLATTFAVVFVLVESFVPGSFSLNQVQDPQDFQSFLYFSLVTISTLGYGDIVPVTAGARGLAAIESIIGQFYFAFLVARLLSLFLQNNNKDSRKSPPRPVDENDPHLPASSRPGTLH